MLFCWVVVCWMLSNSNKLLYSDYFCILDPEYKGSAEKCIQLPNATNSIFKLICYEAWSREEICVAKYQSLSLNCNSVLVKFNNSMNKLYFGGITDLKFCQNVDFNINQLFWVCVETWKIIFPINYFEFVLKKKVFSRTTYKLNWISPSEM